MGPFRGPVDHRKDSNSDLVAVINTDYLARVDTAKQTIVNHALFKGIIDELPVDITGIQVNHSGVQAWRAQIQRVLERAPCCRLKC